MEPTYTQRGDYLIPNLVLSDTKEYHIGKYGRMRRIYLKEHRPAIYSTLLLTEKLFSHLSEIDAACKTRLDIIEAEMMCQEGVTEALKAAEVVSTVFRTLVCSSGMNEVSQQWRHPQQQPPDASYSCTSYCPTGCRLHGATGHRPA